LSIDPAPADSGDDWETSMSLNRRELIVLTAVCAAGCSSEGGGSDSVVFRGERTVDAGPVDQYATDGLYDGFRKQGFFIVRRQGELIAFSSVCTHRDCTLDKADDHWSLYCKCHGSRFDAAGKVIKGPAKRDLPRFATEITPGNLLLVKVSL
jgi:Rieske Fe-S protein